MSDGTRARRRDGAELAAIVYEIGLLANEAGDLDDVLEAIMRRLCVELDADWVGVGLVSPTGDEVIHRCSVVRDGRRGAFDDFRVRLDEGVVGKVVRTGESQCIDDVRDVDYYHAVVPEVKSEAAVPLKAGDVVIGVLNVESTRAAAFGQGEMTLLNAVATPIALTIRNARLFDEERRQLEKLRRIEQLRDDVVAMVVHDLRSPLTVIQTALEFISLHLDGAAEGVEASEVSISRDLLKYLRNAQGASQEMSVLINGMLDLQKLEAGALEIRRNPCSCQDLVRSAVSRVQVVAEAKQIELVGCFSDELPVLRCDVDLVSRVLENLLNNALKFTPERGRVTLSVVEAPTTLIDARLQSAALDKPLDAAALFCVADTGPGIPREERERVFEKFAVVETRRQGEKKFSTGLGLAFCRLAITSHGGAIWVEGAKSSGSSFCVLLPFDE